MLTRFCRQLYRSRPWIKTRFVHFKLGQQNFCGFNFCEWLLTHEKRENKYLTKITNRTVTEMFSMIEGIIKVLAHVPQMYVRVSCSASTKRLTCCCHQCAIHTLATKSELNSVYIASAGMHIVYRARPILSLAGSWGWGIRKSPQLPASERIGLAR